MTSPYFDDIRPQGYYYYNNLNCTWMLKADQGSYINFEIDFFQVKSDTAGPCVTQPQNNVTPKNYINDRMVITRPFPINHRPIAINMQCNKIPLIAYCNMQ